MSNQAQGGRYRLVAYATQAQRSDGLRAQMVLLDPQGNVVDRFTMNSGGEGRGDLATGQDAPLPGLRQTLNASGVITSYAIETGERTRVRNDPGFTLSDGRTGAMTWGLTMDPNAPDGRKANGQLRNGFLIHAGGRGVGTHGCFEFVDPSNRMSNASDQAALRFRNRMAELQRQGVAPTALELIGSNGAPAGGPMATPAGQPDPNQDAAQELDRRRNVELEANNASRNNGNDSFTEFFMSLLRMFLPTWLTDLISSNTPNTENLNASEVDNTPVSTRSRAGYALDSVRADVRRVWEQFQERNNNQPPTHTTPIRQGGRISSDFGNRERPTEGASTNHKGLDITGGGDIHPSAPGVVLFAGRTSGYGYNVIIGHADGTTSFYGHMTGARMPTVGAVVGLDDTIGVMGSTGVSTGVHLHYEQRRLEGGRMVAYNPTIDGRTYGENNTLATSASTNAMSQARAAVSPESAGSLPTAVADSSSPSAPPARRSYVNNIAIGSVLRS